MNQINFINEIVYYNVLILSLSFTPFLPEKQEDDKIMYGSIVNAIVIVMLVINVSVIVFESLY